MKVRFTVLFILIASFLGKPTPSVADVGQGLVLFPSVSIREEKGTLAGDQNALHQDFRLGYLMSGGIYVGALYSRSTSIGAGGTEQESFGNGIGFFYSSVALIGTYYFTSVNKESNNSTTIKRSEGSGYQLDLSVMVPVTSAIHIGAVLTQKVLTFQKLEVNGVVTVDRKILSYTYPFFGALFLF